MPTVPRSLDGQEGYYFGDAVKYIPVGSKPASMLATLQNNNLPDQVATLESSHLQTRAVYATIVDE